MTDLETREQNRISKLGLIVLIMAMLSLFVVLWTSYQDRQETQCQKELNARFLIVLKDRASIADGDRQAIRDLVNSLTKAETDKESQAAIVAYDQANKELDKLRTRVKYPAENLCD